MPYLVAKTHKIGRTSTKSEHSCGVILDRHKYTLFY